MEHELGRKLKPTPQALVGAVATDSGQPKVRKFHPSEPLSRLRMAGRIPGVTTHPARVAGLLGFALTRLKLAAATADPTLIPSIFAPESTPAQDIKQLSWFVLTITGAIFVVVFSLLVYAIIRFRRRDDDVEDQEPPQVYGSNPVEVAWTTVPLLIVVVLTLATARFIQQIQNAPRPPTALEVQVTGHQWWWEFRYPKLGIVTANELHVPVSARTKPASTFLLLQSADVAHSFWVPRLSGKTDLIPNRRNEMWIEPQRTGLFLGQCAEYCGTQHAKMLLRVYVHTPEDFDRWVKEQQAIAAGDPAVAAGRLVFERTACINCHTLNGTVGDGRFGPDLSHLMSRATLGAGAVANSPAGLRAWINNPNQFKPGVLMPAMNLTGSELDQLVTYLATLK
jgi:cytochrome c oxidase subunit 2